MARGLFRHPPQPQQRRPVTTAPWYVFACGAECHAILWAGHWDAISRQVGITVETTIVQPGGGTAAYKMVAASGTPTYLGRTLNQSTIADRFYFYVGAFPNTTDNITQYHGSVTVDSYVKLSSSGQVQIRSQGSGADVNVGSAVSTGSWHYLDVQVDTSAATATIKARLDGGTEASDSCVQSSIGGAPGPMVQLQRGWSAGNASSGTIYYDQTIIAAGSYYPIGTASLGEESPNGNYITDSFTRTTSNSWGTADVGGAYTLGDGTATNFSTNGTEGVIATPVGAAQRQRITGVLTDRAEVVFKGKWSTANASRTNEFQMDVQFNWATVDGYFYHVFFDFDPGWTSPHLGADYWNGSTNTNIGTPVDVTRETLNPNTYFWVKVAYRVYQGTTYIWAKTWQDGTTEPAGWDYTGTNSFAALQRPGAIAFDSFTLTDASTWTWDSINAAPNDVAIVASTTITVPLLDASNALYAPTLTAKNTLTVPLLDAGPALYAPSVGFTLTIPALDAANAVYAPTLVAKNLLTVPLLDAGPTLYAPTIVPGPAQLTVPLLDAANALYSPTLAPQAVTLTVPALDASNALYAPSVGFTITLGTIDGANALYAPVTYLDQFVTVPVLDAVAAVYAPTLVAKNLIDVPVLDAANALYAPTLAPQPVTLTVPALDAVNALYAPTVAQVGGVTQTVTLGLLDATGVLYAPSLSATLTVPSLDAVNAVYAPSLRAVNTLTVGLIDGLPALYAPTLAPQPVTVTLPQLDAANAVYAPTVTPAAWPVIVPFLDAVPAVYAPVLYLDQFLTPPLLDSGPTLYAPTVSVSVTLPLLDSGPTLYAPVVYQDQFLTPPLLDSGPALYAPAIGSQGTLALLFLDAASELYAPTVTAAPISVTLALLTSTSALYAPTLSATVTLGTLDAANALYGPSLTPKSSITLGTIDAVNALYAPTFAVGAVTLNIGLLTSAAAIYDLTVTAVGGGVSSITLPQLDAGNALYAPTVAPAAGTITLGTIDAANAVFAPTVTNLAPYITLPTLDAGAALYAPAVTPSWIVSVPLLDGVATVYAPQLAKYNTLGLDTVDAGRALYPPSLEGGINLPFADIDIVDIDPGDLVLVAAGPAVTLVSVASAGVGTSIAGSGVVLSATSSPVAIVDIEVG